MDCRGVFGGVAFCGGGILWSGRLCGWRFWGSGRFFEWLCGDGSRWFVRVLDFCAGLDFVVISKRIGGGLSKGGEYYIYNIYIQRVICGTTGRYIMSLYISLTVRQQLGKGCGSVGVMVGFSRG